MLPLEQPDRIHVAFDDHRLVANAGLLLPVTLARHLGLGELVDRHIDLGRGRVVHHSVILEFDVPSYRTNAAQQRGQAKEVNRQN